jgi:predicted regulator of Ras-like GTPase activity (Roadblock/LC7/MglB family)
VPLSGDLSETNIVNVIELARQSGAPSRLIVRSGAKEASLFLKEGEAVHAECGLQVGEEVIYELLVWENGSFELRTNVEPPEQTVTTPWSSLLLEGLQRADEAAERQRLEEIKQTKEIEMADINELLREMASEIPGFASTDVVGMDGVSIGHHAINPSFNSEAASAQFAMVMKLVQKTTDQLKAGDLEDNLTTTRNAYIVARFLGDGSYYLGVAVDRQAATLGNLRLITQQYAEAIWNAIPKRKR